MKNTFKLSNMREAEEFNLSEVYSDGLDDSEFEAYENDDLDNDPELAWDDEAYELGEEPDVEDPAYWDDAVEIDPDTAWDDTLDDIKGDQQTGYFDNFNDKDADEYGAYGSERFFAARDLGKGMSTKEIHDNVDEDFSGLAGDYAEPVSHDETPADYGFGDDFMDAMNPDNYSDEEIRFGNY